MIKPRWYVVDARGLATLCKDADDAAEVAADAFVQWPQHGPHTVALLGDVATEQNALLMMAQLVEEVREANAKAGPMLMTARQEYAWWALDDFVRLALDGK